MAATMSDDITVADVYAFLQASEADDSSLSTLLEQEASAPALGEEAGQKVGPSFASPAAPEAPGSSSQLYPAFGAPYQPSAALQLALQDNASLQHQHQQQLLQLQLQQQHELQQQQLQQQQLQLLLQQHSAARQQAPPLQQPMPTPQQPMPPLQQLLPQPAPQMCPLPAPRRKPTASSGGRRSAASTNGAAKSHICLWPDCGKGFDSRWALERHAANHTEKELPDSGVDADSFVERRLSERLRGVEQILEKTREKLEGQQQQQQAALADLTEARALQAAQHAEMERLQLQSRQFCAILGVAPPDLDLAPASAAEEPPPERACVLHCDPTAALAASASAAFAPPADAGAPAGVGGLPGFLGGGARGNAERGRAPLGAAVLDELGADPEPMDAVQLERAAPCGDFVSAAAARLLLPASNPSMAAELRRTLGAVDGGGGASSSTAGCEGHGASHAGPPPRLEPWLDARGEAVACELSE